MSDARLAPGMIPIPDPTVLTNEAVRQCEERLRREIGSLKELHEVRFDALTRLVEQGRMASREAVEAALQTRKEAADEAKASTGKQFEAMDRRISEVKERLDTGEGATRGSVDTRQERRSELGASLQIAAFVVSIISLLIVVALAIVTLPHSAPIPVTAAPSSVGAVK